MSSWLPRESSGHTRHIHGYPRDVRFAPNTGRIDASPRNGTEGTSPPDKSAEA